MTMPDADDRRPLLHDIFYETAARFPDRVAVDVPPDPSDRPDRVLVTYRELARRADDLAAWLQPVAARDAVVAVLVPRESPDLYAAQLGAMAAGAAYTCLDAGFPDDHIRRILENAGPVAAVADEGGASRLRQLGFDRPIYVRGMTPPAAGGERSAARADSTSLAYVVFTSGTTGRPKGVAIEHRGAVNLVRANVGYFGLTPRDRVAQCSSASYDSSLEEAWLAFAVGATLVPLDDRAVRAGPDLVAWLRAERVTTLCPPPTLLRATGCADPARALPDLRLLYVGGEPLPRELADRWAAGRRMENGYGPTECTVTVVRGPVVVGESVTIGRPVVGHEAWVLDEDLNEVPDGTPGELCISGIGLARGYHRLPELTAAKFPTHPRFGRIYRTGDSVRRTESGALEHLGRLDGQVKVRGYRIELAAIEAALERCPGVRAAACRVQGDERDRRIAAHVVPDPVHGPPSVAALRAALERELPGYMVPSAFGFRDRLPTHAGGKLNRDALPVLAEAPAARGREVVAPGNDRQRAVVAAFAHALNLSEAISTDDDFFLHLGGDSIRAVVAVVRLRADGYASATVRDLYQGRTAAGLADRLPETAAPAAVPSVVETKGVGSPRTATAVQAVWLVLNLVAGSAVAAVAVTELLPFAWGELGPLGTLAAVPVASLLGVVVYAPAAVLSTAVMKWLLIGRYRAGRYPVWGGFYVRHWIVTHAAQLIPWALIEGTGFQAAALRALGAKVGRRVHLHRGVEVAAGGWDLLDLGDDVTVNQDARILPLEWTDRHLVFGPVVLADGATLEVRSGVSPDTVVGRNGCLSSLSWLPPGGRVGDGERWDGVPAGPAGAAEPPPALTHPGELSPLAHGLLTVLGRCLRVQVPYSAAAACVLAARLAPDFGDRWATWPTRAAWTWTEALVLALSIVAAVPLSLLVQGLMMRTLGRVRPGVYARLSWTAIRIGLKTGLTDSANRWLSGSVYWPGWLRLAGMRIGRGCEISTVIDAVPETVTVGAESFFADGVYLCGAVRRRGTVTVAETVVGRDTFLGNHAVLPAGVRWPDGLFVGVSTVADARRVEPDSAWFGHPPMELPRREVTAADRRLTHRPGALRFVNRLFWETLRFALPLALVPVAWGWYRAVAAAPVGPGVRSLIVAPAATLAALGWLVLAAVALKWGLIGRVRPGTHPLWSCWCSRWDFCYVAWGYLARPAVAALEGTLLLNAVLRLLGTTVGRGVVLGPGFSQVVDPDMIALGDGATVSADFQAHTFEDRVLKIDRLRVGVRATVGAHAVVFYGADVGDRTWVAPHAVVMKGEVLAADGRYAGCPTAPVAEDATISTSHGPG